MGATSVMVMTVFSPRVIFALCLLCWGQSLVAASASPPKPGLLFYLSGSTGTTAEVAFGNTAIPNFDAEITSIKDGARADALSCGNTQRLAYWAPGNIFAQRGTLSFFWRSRDPVGPTEFPVFRVAYADSSIWDMTWLRIDYNGHGFDAFVSDASLSRIRVSVPLQPFPSPKTWIHLTLAWDETKGIRFYIDGKLAATKETKAILYTGLDQFGPHSRIISPNNVQSDYNYVRGGDLDEVRIVVPDVGEGSEAVDPPDPDHPSTREVNDAALDAIKALLVDDAEARQNLSETQAQLREAREQLRLYEGMTAIQLTKRAVVRFSERRRWARAALDAYRRVRLS